MAREQVFKERMTSFLGGLSPAARSMLERRNLASAVDGRRLPPGQAAVPERGDAQPPPGPVIDMRDLVFASFSPFVIDERLSRRQPGWLERQSLDGIWQFLCRELLPNELAEWDRPRRIAADTGVDDLERLVSGLRRLVFVTLDRNDRATSEDPRAHQRFVSRMGGEIAYADCHDLLRLSGRIGDLERTFLRLPQSASGGEFSDRLFADVVAEHLAASPDDAAYLAAGIAARVASTTTFARLAASRARSPSAADIRRSTGAPFIDFALSMAERHSVRLRSALADGGQGADAADIQRFHDALRGVAAIVDLSVDSGWRTRVADMKRALSEALTRELDRFLPTLRRAFRSGEGALPSDADGRDAVRIAAIYAKARLCRENLAVNELLARQAPVIEQAIATYSAALIDGLRQGGGDASPDIQASFGHMLAVAGHVHGESFAACLKRSAGAKGATGRGG